MFSDLEKSLIIKSKEACTIPISKLSGRRKATTGELEYLKGVLLEDKTDPIVKKTMSGICISSIVFSWCGIFLLLRDVYSSGRVQSFVTPDYIILGLVCTILFVVGLFGLFVFVKLVKNSAKDTFKRDVKNGRFSVVDVDVVDFSYHDSPDSIEDIVYFEVKDCDGNISDTQVLGSNWEALEGAECGIIVILQPEGEEEQVLHLLFPQYSESNPYCRKYEELYKRKWRMF